MASVWSSRRLLAAAVVGVEGAQDPGAGPRDHPGSEDGRRWRHAVLVGVGGAARPSRRQKSLQSHPPHIRSHRAKRSRLHAPRTTFGKAVTRGPRSPYLFDMAADPQRQEAPSNDLFGRWLAHHEQQTSEQGDADRAVDDIAADSSPPPRASRRHAGGRHRLLRARAGPPDRQRGSPRRRPSAPAAPRPTRASNRAVNELDREPPAGWEPIVMRSIRKKAEQAEPKPVDAAQPAAAAQGAAGRPGGARGRGRGPRPPGPAHPAHGSRRPASGRDPQATAADPHARRLDARRAPAAPPHPRSRSRRRSAPRCRPSSDRSPGTPSRPSRSNGAEPVEQPSSAPEPRLPVEPDRPEPSNRSSRPTPVRAPSRAPQPPVAVELRAGRSCRSPGRGRARAAAVEPYLSPEPVAPSPSPVVPRAAARRGRAPARAEPYVEPGGGRREPAAAEHARRQPRRASPRPSPSRDPEPVAESVVEPEAEPGRCRAPSPEPILVAEAGPVLTEPERRPRRGRRGHRTSPTTPSPPRTRRPDARSCRCPGASPPKPQAGDAAPHGRRGPRPGRGQGPRAGHDAGGPGPSRSRSSPSRVAVERRPEHDGRAAGRSPGTTRSRPRCRASTRSRRSGPRAAC